jgi:hypothetical protein
VRSERLPAILTARLRQPGAFAREASLRVRPTSLFNDRGSALDGKVVDDVAAAVDTAVGLLQKDPSLV